MNEKIKRPGLTGDVLKLFAMIFMLIDHMWATVVSGGMWMTALGRLAFPIFAFGIAEGYAHTSDRKAYMKRMLKWALISEIPFNLMSTGAPIFPFHQNVMFTFLLALMAMSVFDRAVVDKNWLKGGAQLVGLLVLSIITFPDYGIYGFMTTLMFHVLRGKRFEKTLQLLGMVFIHCVWIKGLGFPVMLFGSEVFIPMQAFAVLALPFIWLYNGEKGNLGMGFRRFGYAFYPLHMLLLWLYAIAA